jgi:hypothetical protein
VVSSAPLVVSLAPLISTTVALQPASTGWLYTPPSSAAALTHPFNQFEMTRMLLDQGAAIAGIHEELALMREFLMGRPSQPPPRASLPTTMQATLLAPSAPSTAASNATSVSEGMPIHRVSFPHSLSAAPTMDLGHPSGAHLLVVTAAHGGSLAVLDGHHPHRGPRAPNILYGASIGPFSHPTWAPL